MPLDVQDSYNEDHEAFRDSVRKFLATEVVPVLDAWRTAGRIPGELLASAGEQGFLGTSVPEEFGGGGVDDPRFVAVLVEEAMVVGAAGLASVLARHCGVSTSVLLSLEPGEARSSWLAGVASGELLAVPAVLTACPGRRWPTCSSSPCPDPSRGWRSCPASLPPSSR